jgi:hypothetical protein
MKIRMKRVLEWRMLAMLMALLTLSVSVRHAQAADEADEYPRSTYVRVLHAVPQGPKVDVYFDGKKQANDFRFGSLSKYMRLPAGIHRVSVMTNGSPSRTLFSSSRRFRINRFYTVMAYGTQSRPVFRVLDETSGTTHPRMARVYVSHLSAGAPAVDVVARTEGGRWVTLLRGLRYGQTRTLLVSPTKATLYLRSGGYVVHTIPGVELQAGRRYSAFAFGRVGARGDDHKFQVFLDPSASQ